MGVKKDVPDDDAVLAEMREWLEYSKNAEFRGMPSEYERKRGAKAFNKLIERHPALAKAHGFKKLT
jgi:hypothetical protein